MPNRSSKCFYKFVYLLIKINHKALYVSSMNQNFATNAVNNKTLILLTQNTLKTCQKENYIFNISVMQKFHLNVENYNIKICPIFLQKIDSYNYSSRLLIGWNNIASHFCKKKKVLDTCNITSIWCIPPQHMSENFLNQNKKVRKIKPFYTM